MDRHQRSPSQGFAGYGTAYIKPWLSDSLIVKMVNAQNADTNKLKQAQIDTLDITWLERSDPHLINAKMSNELSTFLRKKRDELKDVVMEDDLGLNVGQTDLTEDYNQGDETKCWKSFGSGPDGMVVDKIKPDGGRPHISQASRAIKDPATGMAIGAVTIGIDYDGLVKTKR